MIRLALAVVFILGMASVAAQDRETKVRRDRAQLESQGRWIYNDLPAGMELAEETNKPLLVVFRCIPCEHCAQLDEEVVEENSQIQSLLDKFVCVRVVQANGMDLSLFQFDYDQSWAAFLMNADKTIYGRYGTRSHQTESENDVSLEGFAKALEGALKLHQLYPQMKQSLAAKRGPDSTVSVPEEFASLKGKYSSKLDYEGKVVQSCIHCHQVGEALRLVHRSAGEPIPVKVLFPYPHPKSLGLIMVPKEKATVAEVVPGSPAAKSGFQAGDQLVAISGQPLLSIADIQWVLHHAGEEASLDTEIMRDGQSRSIQFRLPSGWRERGDISWRTTSWDLRRMATGGLVFEEITENERESMGLSGDRLALRIKHVGQYGAHAASKKAGFQKGDVLIAVDGDDQPKSESLLLAALINTYRPGDQVPVTVVRNNEKLMLQLPIQ